MNTVSTNPRAALLYHFRGAHAPVPVWKDRVLRGTPAAKKKNVPKQEMRLFGISSPFLRDAGRVPLHARARALPGNIELPHATLPHFKFLILHF